MKPENSAERKLIQETGTAQIINFSDAIPTDRPDEKNIIRTDLLRWLITTKQSEIDPQGLQIRGARFTGSLDLSGCHIKRRLKFEQCLFEEKISLNDANILTTEIFVCKCQGISAIRLKVAGSLFLHNGFSSHAPVNLTRATALKST